MGAVVTGAGLLAGLIGFCIYFLPSVLAVLRRNIYKGQVIKYQLIIIVINFLVSLAVSFIGVLVKSSFIGIICTLGSGVWGLITLVLWFYVLINAFRDTQMTLLSRFGINI